jgi:hypothetical protein
MSEAQDPEELFIPAEKLTPLQVANFLEEHKEVLDRAADGRLCHFCLKAFTPEESDDPDATYRQVESWVTGAKSQSPVLREQTGRRAHKECIDKLIDGQAVDQDRIPGLEEL